MKRLFVLLFGIFICTVVQADTITLNFLNEDDTNFETKSCTLGGDLIVPSTTPTKHGYDFIGWDIQKAKELEYITFQGNNYIDTGIMFDSDEIKYESKMNGTGFVFGAAHSCNSAGAINSGTGTLKIGTKPSFVAGDTEVNFISIEPNSSYTYKLYIKKSTHYARAFIDNNDWSFSFSGTPISNKEIYIGTVNKTSGYFFYFKGNIYYFRIKKDGVLVRDFIPAKDPDGVVCMYDKVSKSFFYPTNGSLVAGPEIQ